MTSIRDSNTGLSSSSTGFKIRRVTSGLLPQQVNPGFGGQSQGEIFSDADDEARIETPVSLKGSSFVIHDAIRNTQTSHSTPKLPASGTPLLNAHNHFTADNGESIQSHPVGHPNYFRSSRKLADRDLDTGFYEKHIMNQSDNARIDKANVLFDPLNQEDRNHSPHIVGFTYAKEGTHLHKNSLKSETSDFVSSLNRMPRKSSPLRQVVGVSSSMKSAAEEIADEIGRSGATKSKTTQEILDQINSSVERLRERDNTFVESLIDDEGSEDEREMLQSLDQFLVRKSADDSHNSFRRTSGPSHVDNDLLTPIKPLERPTVSQSKASTDDATHEALLRTDHNAQLQGTSRLAKRNASKPNRKLSGKYARDLLRKRKIKNKEAYEVWLKGKWNKLKRLILLSIPKEVLVNSKLVAHSLECGRRELIERIQFLESRKLSH